ncbi:MAG: glycosyltransferase N-terminal domain-containing protein [Pseudomonadota bacterium]
MTLPRLKPAPGLRYNLFLNAYVILMLIAEPLVWRYFRKRAKADPDYMAHPQERRGAGQTFDADLWVHAVSLGEFTSAAPLIRMALDQGFRVLTTHATPAGRRAAEAEFGGEQAFSTRYMPIDRPRYWRRFFLSVAPKAALIMEVEFWPVMIEEARRAGCVLCLANSQVPSKSFPRARRLARLFGHPAASVAAVFAKSEPIAARFRTLGADPVVALGETRFDIPPPADQIAAGQALKGTRKVLTLASVVAGEEDTYLAMIQDLLAEPDPPLVIWVPRAPERFDDHARLLEDAGLRVARRSTAFSDDLSPNEDLTDTQILLGNSLGEMFFYLAPADAVIVGGGFTEKGAHNVIEPLSLGKPVITGPSVWTIEFPAVEAEAAGVLTVVKDPTALPDAVRAALGASNAAEAFHAAHQGASRRILDAILPVMEGRP